MSPQTDYSQDMSQAFAGLRADSGFGDVVSAAAEEVIRYGLLTVEDEVDPDLCRLPGADQIVVTDDGGTWTALDLVTTVNGVAVTTTYATSKAASMTAHAAAIQALAFVATAVYAADTITIVAAAGVKLTVSVDVSGITGTMTITSIVGSISDDIKGISTHRHAEYGSSRNTNLDRVVMTLSGDALAANDTVDGFINGVALAQVTFDTSEAITLQLVANAIQNIAGVLDAVVNATARTITIRNNPTLLMEDAVLTVTDDALAVTAPSFAAAYTKQDSGVPVTDVAYLAGETVGSLRKGRIWVVVEEAIVKTDSVFVRINTGTGSQRGAFRKDIDGGTAVAVPAIRFAGPSQLASDGVTLVAKVELNLP